MKLRLTYLLLSVVALLCMGMGGLGGAPEGTVPETDVLIHAEIKDLAGTVTSLDQFSMDGKSYLDAWRGKGKLTIPFQTMETLTFGAVKGGEAKVVAKLKSGEVVDLVIRSRAQFHGSTGYGAFQISAKDVATIDFP